VNAGSDLTANRIVQSALAILGTSTNHALVTIVASDSSGNPLASGFAEPALVASGAAQQPLASGDPLDSIGGVINEDSPFAAVSAKLSDAQANSVPEPSSWVLVLIGVFASSGGIVRIRRRRRRPALLIERRSRV
jgi:hypothetical protein